MTIPALHPHIRDEEMKPSPKRKRTSSTSEILKGFAPEIGLAHLNELGAAAADSRFAAGMKGVRNSSQVLVTPKHIVEEDVGRRREIEGVEEGANSPRTAVAKRFGAMELKGETAMVPVMKFGGSGDGEKERKKARLEGFEDVADASTNDAGEESVGGKLRVWHNQHMALAIRDGGSNNSRIREREEELEVEIPETPQPPAPSSHRGSPPPPAFHPSPPSSPSTSTIKAHAKRPPKDSQSEKSDLTWQDSEITGHLALDPDDDGTGINGIGFRPTPAMAYARSQRRRQQVMEWKLRESRDARSRRAEERRRGRGVGLGVGGKERVVRFAEG